VIDCLDCGEGLILNTDLACKVGCQASEFVFTNKTSGRKKCQLCDKSCVSCDGPTKSDCLSCLNETYIKLDKGRCIDCSKDFEEFPEECIKTKKVEFNYPRRTQKMILGGEHQLMALMTDVEKQKAAMAKFNESEWLDKFFDLKINIESDGIIIKGVNDPATLAKKKEAEEKAQANNSTSSTNTTSSG
jgi:hypothetical protein